MGGQSWRRVIIKIACFYGVFIVFGLFLFLSLGSYYRNNFRQSELDRMMKSTSIYRDKTDNPCLYSIFGDPIDAGEKYVKVILNCADGTRSTNTIDLRAIEGDTWLDLLIELGRINGFDVIMKNNSLIIGKSTIGDELVRWNCFLGSRKIADFSESVTQRSEISCRPEVIKKNLHSSNGKS